MKGRNRKAESDAWKPPGRSRGWFNRAGTDVRGREVARTPIQRLRRAGGVAPCGRFWTRLNPAGGVFPRPVGRRSFGGEVPAPLISHCWGRRCRSSAHCPPRSSPSFLGSCYPALALLRRGRAAGGGRESGVG